MMTGKVVAYYNRFKDGIHYLKGEDGTICFPNRDDPRISRAHTVWQVQDDRSRQTFLGDFGMMGDAK